MIRFAQYYIIDIMDLFIIIIIKKSMRGTDNYNQAYNYQV